ncbi:MAG: PDDEXK nuclease domain-containing protein [Elusimicrobiota bacterium]
MKKKGCILIPDKKYISFLNEIKQKIASARVQASRQLNKELIKLYWDLGKTIIEKQKQYGWGHGIVEKLAGDLQNEFPNLQGYSSRNLWDMRRFYDTYRDSPILRQIVAEIPWGHNLMILNKISNMKEREYYIKASSEMGWSRNVLLNQINADAYGLSTKIPKQHNFPKTLPAHLSEQADESLKSVYNLDFLGITKPVLERDLEKRLIEKIKHFLLELGSGFSFIGNQYRLELDGAEYFVDLLFFNRKIKCLVAVELKTGKFQPEYAGKMDFYLHLLNEQTRLKDENPPIGIILCADKSNITVEYALRSVKNPMGVSKYHLTTKLPAELKKVLPSEKEMKNRLLEEIK